MLYTSSVNSFYVKPKSFLGSLDISKETSNTFNRFIETYTRIFSVFCLVAVTVHVNQGQTIEHSNFIYAAIYSFYFKHEFKPKLLPTLHSVSTFR